MIRIHVNGKPREIEPPSSITAMLEALNVNPKQVAVAVNGDVVRRVEWGQVTVAEGDAVEIVRAVGGGVGTKELIAVCSPAICRVRCLDLASSGSAFFVRPDILITCNHVVARESLSPDGFVELEYSKNVVVQYADDWFAAELIHGLDDMRPYFCDYAILRVDLQVGSALDLGAYESVQPGDDVLVLGYPLETPGLTATRGMVATTHVHPSHTNQLINLNLIRIDGTVNPGNSGGPLVDSDGRVIGVITLRHGSITEQISRLRTLIRGAEQEALFSGILDVLATSNTYLNPGLAEAVSIQYAAAKIEELGV